MRAPSAALWISVVAAACSRNNDVDRDGNGVIATVTAEQLVEKCKS